MRRISDTELELNPLETKCYERYEELIDAGESATWAAITAIKEYREVSFTFQEWLRGDRKF